MRKDLTTKDVLYALEYLGEALERIQIRTGKAVWRLRNSGQAVKDRIAFEVQQHSGVATFSELSKTIVVWRRAA